MIKPFSSLVLWLFLLLPISLASFPMQDLPVLYQGRIREHSAYAQLWLYDFYHSTSIKKADIPLFGTTSPEEILWRLHIFGHVSLDEAPFFWINDNQKRIFGLNEKSNRFSYSTINQKLSDPSFLELIIALEFNKQYFSPSNHEVNKKIELVRLSKGLWIGLENQNLKVFEFPENLTWKNLKKTTFKRAIQPLNAEENALLNDFLALIGSLKSYESMQSNKLSPEDALQNSLGEWQRQGLQAKEIALGFEELFPIESRLLYAGELKMLPSKRDPGQWYSLKALNVYTYNPITEKLEPVANFTPYPDVLFQQIRDTYQKLTEALLLQNHDVAKTLTNLLSDLMHQGYGAMAGKPIKKLKTKTLYYPSNWQLKAERIYYNAPLIELSLLFYFISLIAFILALKLKIPRLEALALFLLLAAFAIHSIVIALRCYILDRPPVSNMFETIIYVPWIAVSLSFFLKPILKTPLLFIGSSITALSLLILLKVSNMNHSLENVQAVLDSQYWLIIHVMMIVGSYGVFMLSGIIAHFYLAYFSIAKKETPLLKCAGSCILQTLYIGVVLLIPGTILGGVWAAQSWGRFWDWDPKESWAFISSCVYLVGIHAYRFGLIGNFGLSIGAVVGLMTISFTWYGVNYLLGTGLHSYGFGSGGNGYYYSYLAVELFFLIIVARIHKNFLQTNGKLSY